MTYNPNLVGNTQSGIFGLPYSEDDAEILILPVCFEVTTSYGEGTSEGPQAIVDASSQLDLFHPDFKNLWKSPIALATPPVAWQEANTRLKPLAKAIFEALENDGSLTASLNQDLASINRACADLHAGVYKTCKSILNQGKQLILLGGEHSVSLGYIQAVAEVTSDFGILQIDAHMDLRDSYAGFEYSHASIMRNVLKLPQVKKLVQVGIRDCCDEEIAFAANSGGRVIVFDDRSMAENKFKGRLFDSICDEIVSSLPQHVYVSFDIDGLDPSLCPHTGTPVPGGLAFQEACYLLKKVVQSGRKIVGVDLVEVAPGDDQWDGNVGARLLWELILWQTLSRKSK